MGWQDSFATSIWIFAVDRGNAAFVRTGLNQGFIIDMNSASFDPSGFIAQTFLPKLTPYKGNRLAQAVLSHPHGDHIMQCRELENGKPLYPTLLTCPHGKDSSPDEKLNWRRINNQARHTEAVETYKRLYTPRSLPLQTIQFDSARSIPNLEYGIFYIRPPECEKLHPTDDNAYGNSTSMMFYLRQEANSILFPGDMTPEGMAHILRGASGVEKRYTMFDRGWMESHPDWHLKTCNQSSLQDLLGNRGLTVLVAPHHGLESCYSEDLYGVIKGGKPRLVVISERRYTGENEGQIHPNYQSEKGASGLTVQIEGRQEQRRSVSTKDGHHILIVFGSSGGPKVYAEKDIDELTKKLENPV